MEDNNLSLEIKEEINESVPKPTIQRAKKPRTQKQQDAVKKMLEGRKKWANNKQLENKKVKKDKLEKKIEKLNIVNDDKIIKKELEEEYENENNNINPSLNGFGEDYDEEIIEVHKPIIKPKPRKKKVKKIIINNHYEEPISDDEDEEELITNNYYKKKPRKKAVQFIESSSEDDEPNIDLTDFYNYQEPPMNKYMNLKYV
jgi:hypothetical protein